MIRLLRLLTALAHGPRACGPSEPPPDVSAETSETSRPPNIVVVLVDDLCWDEFGVEGHPYAETPSMDRLAAEGALFTNVFHAVPLCSPNRASLLTGQYPSRHGIIDNVARNLGSHRLQTFPPPPSGMSSAASRSRRSGWVWGRADRKVDEGIPVPVAATPPRVRRA